MRISAISFRRFRNERRAFTLIEMLVVVIIIGILLALAVPMLFQTLKANRLSAAGDTLIQQLSLAQQLATSGNFPVEVRFYRYQIDDGMSEQGFHAYQLFRLYDQPQEDPSSPGGELITEKPLGVPTQFGNEIVVSDDPQLTPLASGPLTEDSRKYLKAADASYFSFRFNPDGTTTLNKSVTTSYLTLVNAETEQNTPANFYTIQVDPYNGKLRVYRP